jgi:hypothetical protein
MNANVAKPNHIYTSVEAFGGAVFGSKLSSLLVEDSELRNNSAISGGGVYFYGINLNMVGC